MVSKHCVIFFLKKIWYKIIHRVSVFNPFTVRPHEIPKLLYINMLKICLRKFI